MNTIAFIPFAKLTLTTLYNLMALREEVFTLERHCTEPDFDGLDQKAIHVIMTIDKQIIGTARILPPGIYGKDIVSFGRLAIKKEFRGHSYGKQIMRQIISYITQYYPNQKIEFSAQLYLKKFYEELGFTAHGEVYQEAGIPHIKCSASL